MPEDYTPMAIDFSIVARITEGVALLNCLVASGQPVKQQAEALDVVIQMLQDQVRALLEADHRE